MRKGLRIGGAALLILPAVVHAGGPGAATEVEHGSRLYLAQCASCHGANGQGAAGWREPDASGEMPPPPHDRTGHTWKHADGMLYRIVHDGWRDPFNKTQRLTMPAFGRILKPDDIRAVIDYLKTLWSPEQQRFQADESRKAPFPPEAQ